MFCEKVKKVLAQMQYSFAENTKMPIEYKKTP